MICDVLFIFCSKSLSTTLNQHTPLVKPCFFMIFHGWESDTPGKTSPWSSWWHDEYPSRASESFFSLRECEFLWVVSVTFWSQGAFGMFRKVFKQHQKKNKSGVCSLVLVSQVLDLYDPIDVFGMVLCGIVMTWRINLKEQSAPISPYVIWIYIYIHTEHCG